MRNKNGSSRDINIDNGALSNALSEDIDIIKSGAASLGSHLQESANVRMQQIAGNMGEQFGQLQKRTLEGLETLDGQIQRNPKRSVLVAFAAGLVLSSLCSMGRK